MKILKNVSLKRFNTFGIEANAAVLIELDKPAQVQEIITHEKFRHLPLLILGGGSNILLTKNFEGVVLKINFSGIAYEFLPDEKVMVTAGAGVVWDDLVQFCVNRDWGGLENLSLIPGSVGASPIQNIGAYGVEVKDTFSHLQALDLVTFETRRFASSDCRFGYRSSIFKQELKNRFLITSVSFLLSQKAELNLSYPALISELEKTNMPHNIGAVAEAVKRIRRSKLPDPDRVGNAGSFFKNPVVGCARLEALKSENPTVPFFLQQDGSYKIPAAWLIEQCGWKGKRFGDAGVHQFQPLVLVNFGKASGQEILDLARRIEESVWQHFEIQLENEVNIV